jgi:RpiR family carbohydrate utilization transcriptional regulator
MKVAKVVLKDPENSIRSSIATVAREADVSEPTVNRFCRSLSCAGFPDFKLRLAQSLATGTPYVNRNVGADDAPDTYSSKIFEATIHSLKEASMRLDSVAVERSVAILSQAKRIEFYGLGTSGPVAIDAQHKFFRLNIPVVSYVDILMQRMAASVLGTGDVVVCISYTGRTIPMIEVAEVARNAGATVIGLTKANSPLADVSSLVLNVEAKEDTDIYMPMTSRIVQLTVVDVLATGVTLMRGPDFREHLKKVKDSLKATRHNIPAPEQQL